MTTPAAGQTAPPGAPEDPTTEDPPGTAQAGQEKPKKAKQTEYHLLRLVSSAGADETYAIVARNVKGVGAKDAVRRTITPSEQKESFLAIPSRSMSLITVSLQVKQQTVIE